MRSLRLSRLGRSRWASRRRHTAGQEDTDAGCTPGGPGDLRVSWRVTGDTRKLLVCLQTTGQVPGRLLGAWCRPVDASLRAVECPASALEAPGRGPRGHGPAALLQGLDWEALQTAGRVQTLRAGTSKRLVTQCSEAQRCDVLPTRLGLGRWRRRGQHRSLRDPGGRGAGRPQGPRPGQGRATSRAASGLRSAALSGVQGHPSARKKGRRPAGEGQGPAVATVPKPGERRGPRAEWAGSGAARPEGPAASRGRARADRGGGGGGAPGPEGIPRDEGQGRGAHRDPGPRVCRARSAAPVGWAGPGFWPQHLPGPWLEDGAKTRSLLAQGLPAPARPRPLSLHRPPLRVSRPPPPGAQQPCNPEDRGQKVCTRRPGPRPSNSFPPFRTPGHAFPEAPWWGLWILLQTQQASWAFPRERERTNPGQPPRPSPCLPQPREVASFPRDMRYGSA